MPSPAPARQRIGLLLYPGCLPAGLLAAADLLQAANLRARRPAFELVWVAVKAGEVDTAHGLRMHATHPLDTTGCDAVLVPGYWAHRPQQLDAARPRLRATVDALRALPPTTACWAFCTGVTLLAEAGRLASRPATATWWAAPWLARHHPQVDWQWQHALVDDGAVLTASGTHGYQPIVAREVVGRLGADAWRDVERFAVLPRPRSTPSVFQRLDAVDRADPLLGRLQALVEARPAQQVRLDTLAQALSVSTRTLARRVHAATGHSVGDHVRLIKLRQAGERLLHGGQTLAQVSESLGYADDASLRRSFKRATGLTPGEFVKAHGRG